MSELVNIEHTQAIAVLCTLPYEARDDEWNRLFLENIATAGLSCRTGEVSYGPDGFPYLGFWVPAPGQEFDANSIQELLEQITIAGMGVAVNPTDDGKADWVFSYGDIWNRRHTGKFYSTPRPRESESDLGEAEHKIIVAHPSAAFLPQYVRDALASGLKNHFKIETPGALLITDPQTRPEPSIAFNVFPEDFSDPDLYEYAMRYIAWSLPRNYSLMIVDKNSDLAENFAPLSKNLQI